MRRLFIIVSFVLTVVLVAAAILGPRFGARATEATESQFTQVQRIDVTNLVSTAGIAAPERTAILTFGTTGTVSDVAVEIGDAVTPDVVLATLDVSRLEFAVANAEQSVMIAQASLDRLLTPPTAAQVAAAEAAVAGALAQLTAARNNREAAPEQRAMSCLNLDTLQLQVEDAQARYNDYVKAGLLYDAVFMPDDNAPQAVALTNVRSQYDMAAAQCRAAEIAAQDTGSVDAATAQLAQAEAQLAALLEGPTENEVAIARAQVMQAQLGLDQARQALDDAEITPPFSGVVTDVQLRIGQTASPGAGSITIADLSTLHFDVDIDELDVAQLAQGQSVDIRVDALRDVPIAGTVARVSPAGRTVQGVTTYSARIEVTGDMPAGLRSGMGADIDIVVGEQRGVLAVPTRSIQRGEGGEFVLKRVEGSDDVEVLVVSGQSVGELTVVVGDIDEGDTIYLDIPESLFGFGARRGF